MDVPATDVPSPEVASAAGYAALAYARWRGVRFGELDDEEQAGVRDALLSAAALPGCAAEVYGYVARLCDGEYGSEHRALRPRVALAWARAHREHPGVPSYRLRLARALMRDVADGAVDADADGDPGADAAAPDTAVRALVGLVTPRALLGALVARDDLAAEDRGLLSSLLGQLGEHDAAVRVARALPPPAAPGDDPAAASGAAEAAAERALFCGHHLLVAGRPAGALAAYREAEGHAGNAGRGAADQAGMARWGVAVAALRLGRGAEARDAVRRAADAEGAADYGLCHSWLISLAGEPLVDVPVTGVAEACAHFLDGPGAGQIRGPSLGRVAWVWLDVTPDGTDLRTERWAPAREAWVERAWALAPSPAKAPTYALLCARQGSHGSAVAVVLRDDRLHRTLEDLAYFAPAADTPGTPEAAAVIAAAVTRAHEFGVRVAHLLPSGPDGEVGGGLSEADRVSVHRASVAVARDAAARAAAHDAGGAPWDSGSLRPFGRPLRRGLARPAAGATLLQWYREAWAHVLAALGRADLEAEARAALESLLGAGAVDATSAGTQRGAHGATGPAAAAAAAPAPAGTRAPADAARGDAGGPTSGTPAWPTRSAPEGDVNEVLSRWAEVKAPGRVVAEALHRWDGRGGFAALARLADTPVKWAAAHVGKLERLGIVAAAAVGYRVHPAIVPLLADAVASTGGAAAGDGTSALAVRVIAPEAPAADPAPGGAAPPAPVGYRTIFNSEQERTVYELVTVLFPHCLVVPNQPLRNVFKEEHLRARLDGRSLAYFRMAHVDLSIHDTVLHHPVLGIELDSAYHDAPDRRANDARKDAIFRAGGVPLLRVRPAGVLSREALRDALARALEACWHEVNDAQAGHLRNAGFRAPPGAGGGDAGPVA